jgi:hypothetical protein
LCKILNAPGISGVADTKDASFIKSLRLSFGVIENQDLCRYS